MGTIFLFLVPIIGITVLLTLTLSDFFPQKPSDDYLTPKTSLAAKEYDPPIDTPEFQTGDQARFNFTGDTVLVLVQPASLLGDDEQTHVLYKTPQGNFQTLDLPDNWLVKIPTDTVPVQKPVQRDDILEQYRKGAGK